ncbi:mfs general substrate transporter protein [Rutstroemia sp. NJR-2017a BBW]|nr:mfs general substrate transporter protein [Rutstroemia sp. NJR-2017a BBW]
MNLAYGDLPAHFEPEEIPVRDEAYKAELDATLSKLDNLLIEAQCLHHTATTIMNNLQANPEAMAAVALTLAELSNLLTKMTPNIIPMLKASSPAIFALLASPQFLIAGGVALGVTVVMFGGFKIIKKLSAAPEEKPMAMAMPASPMTPITPAYMEPAEMAPPPMEALEYEGELSSIENWRRGIADAELESVGTSIDGEYITPEVARRKSLSEKIRQRAMEERGVDESLYDDDETRTQASRKSRSSSHRSKTLPIRSRSPVEESVAGDSVRSARTSKSRKSRKSRSEKAETEIVMEEVLPVVEEKKKKKTPLSLFRSKTEKLRSSSSEKEKEKEKEREKGKEREGKKSGHHPLFIEL